MQDGFDFSWGTLLVFVGFLTAELTLFFSCHKSNMSQEHADQLNVYLSEVLSQIIVDGIEFRDRAFTIL